MVSKQEKSKIFFFTDRRLSTQFEFCFSQYSASQHLLLKSESLLREYISRTNGGHNIIMNDNKNRYTNRKIINQFTT